MKKHPVYMICFLAILGVICAGLLSGVNAITAPIIKENKFAAVNKTLEAIKVLEGEVVEGVDLVDGVESIYAGQFEGTTACYAFVVNVKNNFTEFQVLVALSKDGKILAISPAQGSTLTTHGKDSAFAGNTFGIIGSGSDFASKFEVVAGASVTSGSFEEAVKIAFKQLKKLQ